MLPNFFNCRFLNSCGTIGRCKLLLMLPLLAKDVVLFEGVVDCRRLCGRKNQRLLAVGGLRQMLANKLHHSLIPHIVAVSRLADSQMVVVGFDKLAYADIGRLWCDDLLKSNNNNNNNNNSNNNNKTMSDEHSR